MKQDWFDALTNPRIDLRDSAAPDDSQELLADWRPALELLHSGMPENGINLVPRWEEFLAREQQSAERRPAPGNWRLVYSPRLLAVGRYAAVLLLGLAIGLLAVRQVGGGAERTASVPEPHYNEWQQQLMVAMLDSTRMPSAQTLRRAATDLAGCVTCHESALRSRLRTASELPRAL